MSRARDPLEINPALIDWNVFLSPTEHAQLREHARQEDLCNTSASILSMADTACVLFHTYSHFLVLLLIVMANKGLWLWEKCAEMQINIFSDLPVMSVMSMFPFSSSDHLSRGRYYTGRAGI